MNKSFSSTAFLFLLASLSFNFNKAGNSNGGMTAVPTDEECEYDEPCAADDSFCFSSQIHGSGKYYHPFPVSQTGKIDAGFLPYDR